MSDELDKDLDIYLQNLKRTSKKPSLIIISLMSFISLLLFIGFIALKGIIGTLMLLVSFFVVLMIVGSYMIK